MRLRSIPVSAWIGFAGIALALFCALFAPYIAPYGEREVVGEVWEPMGATFLLGTDNLGRDLLSRLIFGAQTTILVASCATLLSFSLGVLLSFTAAVLKGWTDQALSRLNDLMMAIPTLIFALVVLAHMMRMTRAAILNVMASPYVETAELKGLSRMRIIARHAGPNAIAPIINVVALNLAYLVVGVVVVEVVFVYPGIGQYMVDAVTVRDMPVVQACGLLFAAVYIVLNMIADILAIVFNPRLRHPK
ncbi:MAG: ABC transporter permease [Hyphomicrobiales bacterium]|nr:MAG: ABC transporter permease [Hyphomicrobiales bacterium]